MATSIHCVSAETLVASNAELQGLVAERIPRAFSVEVSWEVMATGLLARSAANLDAVAALAERGRQADAEVALRTLYVTVTTMIWIAIDPAQHLPKWQEGSEAMWKKFDSEARRNFGKGVLDDEVYESLSTNKLKQLDQLADDVDAYWPNYISAFRPHPEKGKEMLSFRGLYTAIFRPASRIAHAEVDALQANVRVRPTQIVVSLDEPKEFGRAALSLPLMAFALLVYSHHFGWPGEQWATEKIALLDADG